MRRRGLLMAGDHKHACRQPFLATALMVVALALPGVASGQAATADAGLSLSSAESAYGRIDFESTLRHADAALQAGGLVPSQLARAFELIGISAMALGQRERSRQAFVRLLALNPDAQLERTLSPSLREPFMEARGYWASQTDRLAVDIDFVRERGVLRFRLADPLRLGRTLVVRARVAGTEIFAEARIAAEETVYVQVEGGANQRVEFTYTLLDVNNNRLLDDGDDEVPLVLGEAPVAAAGGRRLTRRQRTILWAVIGGVVGAGAIAGGIAAGVVLNRQAETVSLASDATVVRP